MNRLLRDIITAKKQDIPGILAKSGDSSSGLLRIPFRATLMSSNRPALICEIKKASPSQGVISADFSPRDIAIEYRDGGASALSVLTDVRYFQGAPENVSNAKEASGLPVLCKDFFIDPRQICWADRIGADAVLLIMRILSDSQAEELLAAAGELDLDVLVETHNEAEVERALALGADIIGVNNRDLDTFEVTLEVSERLRSYIPDATLAISESGIESPGDVCRLRDAGYDTFLVGSALMRAKDRAQAIRELRGEAC